MRYADQAVGPHVQPLEAVGDDVDEIACRWTRLEMYPAATSSRPLIGANGIMSRSMGSDGR